MEDKKRAFKYKIKEFEHLCKDKRIKLTHQRMEIFREIAHAHSHPSAEEIYKRLKSKLPMISLDTVYRTLSTFEDCGIISKVQVLDDKGRYDANLISHHHLICVNCKGIVDFYWPSFDKMPLPSETRSWGHIQVKQAELKGICAECRKKQSKKS